MAMGYVSDPVTLPWWVWLLLGLILFFQILTLLGQAGLRGRLRRLEARRAKSSASSGNASAESVDSDDLAERKRAKQETRRQFEEFLAEDPSRRELPKKEQFAAFREWRSERGLTWSG